MLVFRSFLRLSFANKVKRNDNVVCGTRLCTLKRFCANQEMPLEPIQTSKMEFFAKIVNYLRKNLHLRYLTGF